MTLEECISISKSDTSSIGELVQAKSWLAGEYAYLNGKYAQIVINKQKEWDKIRYSGEVKSDTAAERKWMLTDQGQQEFTLYRTLQSIQRLMSGMNSRILLLEGESKSQW